MNLDRTFCTGVRCDRIKTCDRSMYNLKRYFEKQPEDRRWLIERLYADTQALQRKLDKPLPIRKKHDTRVEKS